MPGYEQSKLENKSTKHDLLITCQFLNSAYDVPFRRSPSKIHEPHAYFNISQYVADDDTSYISLRLSI